MKKNVDNGHRRHKCSICERVRFEKFMMKVPGSFGNRSYVVKTRYGNECWVCVDNPDCQQRAINFQTY